MVIVKSMVTVSAAEEVMVTARTTVKEKRVSAAEEVTARTTVKERKVNAAEEVMVTARTTVKVNAVEEVTANKRLPTNVLWEFLNKSFHLFETNTLT